MMTATQYPHIEKDEQGRLFVKGTSYKVIVLLEEHVGMGSDAEALQSGHADLTLAQAHGILSYYYDHKDEIDLEIAERRDTSNRLRASLPESAAMARLRALK